MSDFEPIACTYCDRTDQPVCLAEGGSSPEYACETCWKNIQNPFPYECPNDGTMHDGTATGSEFCSGKCEEFFNA